MLLPAKNIYGFDEFELDPFSRALVRKDTPVPISPKAFDLLFFLVLNPGRVIPKDELLKAVWPDSFVEESNLAQHISALRKALGDRSTCIQTISGHGYQFTAKVEAKHSVDSLPERLPGDILVQTVRERAHFVIKQSLPARDPLALPARKPFSRKAVLRWVSLSLLAAVLIALAGVIAWKRLAPRPQFRKVTVADFTNATGDATFDRTLKRALEIDLEQSPYIDVMSESEVVSTLHLMGRNDAGAFPPEIAKEACERSNRQVLLTGDIASVGHDYLLTLEATDCASGNPLAGAKAEATTREKVLAALDSVADRVRKGLGESTDSLETYQVPIVNATTPSLDALKAYSIGRYMVAQGKSESETLPLFQRAVELDPQFAMAYESIATDYYNQNEFNLASEFYSKAFALCDRVSAKEKLEIQAHYFGEGRKDVLEGIRIYKLWTGSYPHDWVPWINLTNEYTQLGQYAPAVAAGERAVEEAPNRPVSFIVLARAYKRANRFDEARAIARKAAQLGQDSSGLHDILFQIAFFTNDVDAMNREVKWDANHSGSWYFLDLQAEAAAATGHYRKAEEFFRGSYQRAQRESLPETADDILLDQAQMEFEFGLPAVARATLTRISNPETVEPDFATLRAQLGDIPFAEHYLAQETGNPEPGTQMAFVNLPVLEASLAEERGKPLEAIAALEASRPYELADYSVLTLRAEACLEAGQPSLAADAYSKILANPGVDPLSPLYTLAHLGLARAYALKNDRAASRSEYEKFFAVWKDADADIPLLKNVNIEYARLK